MGMRDLAYEINRKKAHILLVMNSTTCNQRSTKVLKLQFMRHIFVKKVSMSKDLNLVVVIGRLVRDPEVRYTSSGTAIAKFAIANNERIKQNNEWTDYTNFFDIVVWGNQAENCQKYLKKGSQVSIEGNLRQNRWVDQASNQNRSKIEIIASSIQFLTPAGGGQANSHYQNESQQDSRPSESMNTNRNQQTTPNNSGMIADPWGDSNSGNSFNEYSSSGFDGSDDDIPF